MTNKEFQALVDADIRRLMSQAENELLVARLKALITKGRKQMTELTERDWGTEDLFDDAPEKEWTNDDDYKEDLKDRYDQLKGT